MAQSLANVLVHLVFSTKERRPFIKDDVRGKLHAYIIGVLGNHDSPSIETNSAEDHIHVLFKFSKNWALAKVIEQVKSASSGWLKEQGAWYSDFYWQRGYGAFSASETHVDALRAYIRGQAEHHKKVSFQDEFRELCRKNNVPLDERYAWD
jgi:REP element-mobilizing transposase RayT